MKKRQFLFLLARITLLFVFYCVSVTVFAIGDSGGGGGSCAPFDGPLADAVRKGQPAKVISEINALVDSREQKVDLLLVLKEKLNGSAKKSESERRQVSTREILEGGYGRCASPSLLDEAVNAGNIEVVRFFLNRPMGIELADPNFFPLTCKDGSKFSENERARRLEAFSMVLQANVFDINSPNLDGRTVLETCTEPELRSLLVKNGARTGINVESRSETKAWSLLEKSIYNVLIYDEEPSSRWRERQKEIDKIKKIAKSTTSSIRDGKMESIARKYCHQYIGERPWNPKTCRQLSYFIKSSPGTFD